MQDIGVEYKLSLYTEIKTVIEGKIFWVTNSIDEKIYVKKILSKECLGIYEILKKNKNKNRAEVKEAFIANDKLIVIEEFINGTTLAEILETRDIEEKEAIEIVNSIIDALEDLHFTKPKVIHRDIKPENIIRSNDGVIKLMDFDASRVVSNNKDKDTVVLGTRGYASPEQFGFAETDARTDIYSMGVLLNYLILEEYPNETIVSGAIGEVIKKAIEIDREKRYKNIFEFRKALNGILLKESEKNIFVGNEYIGTEAGTLYKTPYEKQAKKGKVLGFRSGKLRNKIIAVCWYGFVGCGIITFIAERKVEDIILIIWMLIIPEIILRNFSWLDKYFEKYCESENVKKHKRVIKIILCLIVTGIVGGIVPS